MSEQVEKKPIYKKWWFWGIIIVVLIVALGGSNNTQQPQTTLTTGEDNITNEYETNTSQDKQYVVGEIYQDNNMAIKYVSADENFTGYSQYADVKQGYKVIKAEIEVENLGTTDLYFSAYEFSCYADGYDCESFWSVEESGFSSNLSSKKKYNFFVFKRKFAIC